MIDDPMEEATDSLTGLRMQAEPERSGTSRAKSSITLSVSTKSQAAYDGVRSLILQGRLAPGSVVQQEQLASDLGLSTTPLREALRRLEAEHLVTLDAHRHLRIAPLTARELDEIYFVRIPLDCLAAAMAADRLSNSELATLRRMATRRVDGEPLKLLARNQEFHRTIYAAADNTVLTEILDSLWDRGDRYRIVLMHQRRDIKAADEDHLKIIDALASRDHESVERLMRSHLQKSQDSIRVRLTQNTE
jgi:DNA-binding GntR family transcriptional regulator